MLRASLSMFACLQWCLIDAFGGFDHYPTGRNLAILGVPLAANSEERCWWLEWGIVSGVVTGAPFAALNVELAIGTCRHHLPMVRVEASSFTDQAASTRSYSASHRHFSTFSLWSGRRRPPCLRNRRPGPLSLACHWHSLRGVPVAASGGHLSHARASTGSQHRSGTP